MIAKRIIRRSDMISCLLCKDAPCSAACPKMEPGDILRHVWFDNEDIAALSVPQGSPCSDCDAPCEKV